MAQDTDQDVARNIATAGLFGRIATQEGADTLAQQIRGMPKAALKMMSMMNGIPAHQTDLHVAMMSGQDNKFSEEHDAIEGWFQSGDLILMTGNQRLATVQKTLYKDARSSHVAVVHADFVCIDAIPKIGASNRIVPDVLENVEPGWRVIRHKAVGPEQTDDVMRACAFYLAQPYKILPTKKSAAKFAYCSELARKVYRDIGIKGTGIPNASIIAPAHFDKLADHHPNWEDVTDSLKPAVLFCRKYPEILRSMAKLFIAGLKLNRSRFEERSQYLAKLQILVKAGKISAETARAEVARIREIESNMHNTFWDVERTASGPRPPSGS